MFMIRDLNFFVKMFLSQLKFSVLFVQQLFYAYYKASLFFNLEFLLLLSEGGLNPESRLAIFHPRTSYLLTDCS